MSAREVEEALALLERVARQGDAPSHYVARHLLLALGGALAGAGEAQRAAWLERARRASEAAGPAWGEAVRAELAFACGEFAQCVDPRYLRLPNYDLEYTRSARQRLADRLTAAAALGFALEARDADVLQLADEVLAKFERARGKGSGGTGGAAGATPVEPDRGLDPG